jgi:SAM-dependent methyltransferase
MPYACAETLMRNRIQSKIRQWLEQLRYQHPFYQTLQKRSERVVLEFGVQKWFRKIPPMRSYHWDIVQHIRKNQNLSSVILETGCGIGQTFIMLEHYGFRNFIGLEKDEATYNAAMSMLKQYGLPVRLIHGDGLSVSRWVELESVDIYLPLNWTYFVSEMTQILSDGFKILKPDGLMVIDIIRSDFQPTTSKEALTFSRYPFKHSLKSFCQQSEELGFHILKLDANYGSRINVYLSKTGCTTG